MSKFTRMMSFFKINKKIAIDLGTSSIFIYDKSKRRIVLKSSSVVAIDKRTNEIIAVGNKAKKMFGRTSENVEVINPLAGGIVSDLYTTKEMLKYFLRKLYISFPFKPEVIVTIPSGTTSIEKRAIFETVSGVKRSYLIESPIASLMGLDVDVLEAKGNLIIDIGAGTTDIAVVSVGETIISKSIHIAGKSFDEDIKKYMKKEYNLLIGDRTAEIIKKEIGTAKKLSSEEILYADVKGRDLITGIPKVIEISSNHVYEALKFSVNEIILALKEVLKKCPPELIPDIFNNKIILNGGGSLLKKLDVVIEDIIGIGVKKSEKPFEATIIGAAKCFKNKKMLEKLLMQEE